MDFQLLATWVNDTEIADAPISTHHEVLITRLRPDRQYAYRVRYSADGGITQTHSFRTAPAPGNQHPFKFRFMSDSRGGVGGGERSLNGVNARDLGQFAMGLHNKGAHFICFGGDLVNGYTSDRRDFEFQLEVWKQVVQPVVASIPIYEAIGNHEQVGNFYKVADLLETRHVFSGVRRSRRGREC